MAFEANYTISTMAEVGASTAIPEEVKWGLAATHGLSCTKVQGVPSDRDLFTTLYQSHPVSPCALCFIPSGLFLAWGTYVGYKIIEFLLKDNRANKSDLDELVLLEHSVNLLNAPVILIQFIRHMT